VFSVVEALAAFFLNKRAGPAVFTFLYRSGAKCPLWCARDVRKAFPLRGESFSMRQIVAGLALIIACLGPGRCFADTVLPFVDCVDYDAASDEVTAWFSYANGAGISVNIQIGANNLFDPMPSARNQPTVFLPGVIRNAFSETFPAQSTLTWYLQGNAAVASNDATAYCYHDDVFADDFEG
jgi:hypothetical protein